MFDEVHDLILGKDICRRESGEPMSTGLVCKVKGKTSTCVSSANLNRHRQSRTSGVICSNCGEKGNSEGIALN